MFFRKKDPGGKSERPVSVPFYYILLLKPLINDRIGPRFDVNKYRNEGDFFEVELWRVSDKQEVEGRAEVRNSEKNDKFSFCSQFLFLGFFSRSFAIFDLVGGSLFVGISEQKVVIFLGILA